MTTLYLLTAHLIADFFLQTDWMAVNKSKRMDALLAHVSVYALFLTLATGSIAFGLVTFACHLGTDYVTSRVTRAQWPFLPVSMQPGRYFDAEGTYDTSERYPQLFGLKRSRHYFFCTIGVDQWAHAVQLILTAQLLGLV